jgi:hypothetical protein
MAVGHEDHQRVADTMAVGLGCLDQALDLGVLQVLALRNSRFGGRRGSRALPTVRFSVGGGTSRRFDFAMCDALPLPITVLFWKWDSVSRSIPMSY